MKHFRFFKLPHCFVLLLSGLLFLCLLGACSKATPVFSPQNSITPTPAESLTPTAPPATPTPTLTPTPSPTPTPAPRQVTLLAVGDDLVHGSTLNGGLQEDGTYDFNGFYRHLKDEISAADIAIINQETILGGAEFEYVGYPCFNTPDAMGDAIVNAGFDVVLHATNHTMDKGAKGVENCINFWKTAHPEITLLGIYDSPEAQNTVAVVEKNGIRIAMLNYTYGLNGIPLPQGKTTW